MADSLIQMNNIVKRFKGTVALKGVDFEIKPGEIHALLGENGAGKSTLIKILTGAYQPDEGEIKVEGQTFSSIPIKKLEELGISVVYQDLKLAPGVSVMENILMGKLPKIAGFFVNKKLALKQAAEALEKAGVQLDPHQLVGKLKIADQEVVAIAKSLSKNVKLLILDEPTALLAENDVERLFKILKDLVKQGVAILYISHRLEEIFEICHRVTVLRDGNKIWTKAITEITREELIEAIAGEIQQKENVYYPTELKGTALRVENLGHSSIYHNISFELQKGEVVGLFGLVGSGKTELLKGIYGSMPPESGNVFVEENVYKPRNPRKGINYGIGFVPEDRKSEGYLPRIPIYVNTNIAAYSTISKLGMVHPRQEKRKALETIHDFNVKYSNLDEEIDNLSGGNQQKVVVAKWIGTKINILLLDEPTAGIDVGARRDLFKVTRRLVHEGKSVLYCSSYLPELLEVCDRILVMSRGELTGEFKREEGFNEQEIMRAAYK